MKMGNRQAGQVWLATHFGHLLATGDLYFDDTDIVHGDATYASVWPGAEPNSVIITVWNTEPPERHTFRAWKGFGAEPHERPGFPNSYRIPPEKLEFLAAFRQRLEISDRVDDQELWDIMASFGIRGHDHDEGQWAEDEIKAEFAAR